MKSFIRIRLVNNVTRFINLRHVESISFFKDKVKILYNSQAGYGYIIFGSGDYKSTQRHEEIAMDEEELKKLEEKVSTQLI